MKSGNIKTKESRILVLGNIADSGEKSEFLKAKEILDELNDPNRDGDLSDGIPYVLVFGNHDVWPHTEEKEATTTLGEDYFDEIFWNENATNTKLMKEILNWERDENYKNYKNFTFSYGGINFIGLDFNSREPFMKCGKGVGADAVLDEINKGWLEKKLEEFKGGPAILFAHHPIFQRIIDAFSPIEYFQIKKILENQLTLFDFGGHIHSFEEHIGKLGLFAPENANKRYDPVAPTNVLTTEALMVGSNGRGVATSTPENGVVGDKKGIVRIVKVFDKENINPYNWETTEKGDEFLAFNPSIKEIEYERVCSPGKVCMEFESNFFTQKPFVGCWKVGDSNVECGKEILLTSQDQTIQCSGSQEELKCVFSQTPLKSEVTLFAFSTATSFSEEILKKFEVKEGIFPKIIKVAKEKIGDFIFKSLTTGRNLLEKGRSFRDKVIGLVKHFPEIPVAIFEIDFEKAKEDIDFSGLIMDSDPVKKKAILYMENWPNEVERSKILLLPKE